MTTPTPDRLTAIEALSRAIDWIKPEVSMGGPRGGYVGPVTRQKAVDAIEQGIAALADRPNPGEDDQMAADWNAAATDPERTTTPDRLTEAVRACREPFRALSMRLDDVLDDGDREAIDDQFEALSAALGRADALATRPEPELDEPLRVMGAMAHAANRDHEDNDGCIVCVAARPVLAALREAR